MKNKIFLLFITLFFFSCGEDPIPKPKGYFRIDLPTKDYSVYDARCHHSFEIPNSAKVLQYSGTGKDSCFYNLSYPKLNAKLHFSYLKIDDNFQDYVNDAYNMVYKHEVKASSIESTPYYNENRKVSGLVYELGGDVASSLQFYITDSVHHFLRGSLYFFNKPNADSIAPVLGYVKEDVMNMYKTIHWK